MGPCFYGRCPVACYAIYKRQLRERPWIARIDLNRGLYCGDSFIDASRCDKTCCPSGAQVRQRRVYSDRLIKSGKAFVETSDHYLTCAIPLKCTRIVRIELDRFCEFSLCHCPITI